MDARMHARAALSGGTSRGGGSRREGLVVAGDVFSGSYMTLTSCLTPPPILPSVSSASLVEIRGLLFPSSY